MHGEYENLAGTLVPIGNEFGHLQATEFGPLVLKAVQKWLVAKGHARTFVNTEISRVRRAFRWAVSEQLVEPAVLQGLLSVQPLRAGHTVAQDRARRQPVPWEDVVATMAYCSSLVADMIAIQWYSAARSDSLCRMERDQIDTRCHPWCWTPRHKTEHLGGAELIIPIGPQCQRVLERHLDQDGVIFSPRVARKNRIYRRTYNTNSYSQHIYRAQERANAAGHEIPHWSPHQIRHSREQIVEREFGPEGARAALGHATLDATKIYSHRDLQLAMQVAARLG
jgi:integrase